MRLLFRHEAPGSVEMLSFLESLGVPVEPAEESSMENTTNFSMGGVPFLLTYDPLSRKNPSIYPFLVEAHADNAGEGTQETRATTLALRDRLKGHVRGLIVEDDENAG